MEAAVILRSGVKYAGKQNALAAGVGIGIVLDSAGVAAVLLLHPRVATSAPAAAVILLTAMAALLCAYGYAARVAQRPRTTEAATTVTVGGRFAIVVSGCWILEIVAGNLLGDHLYSDAIYSAALLGVILSCVGAGAAAARCTGRFIDGIAAGGWSGLAGGWVPLFTLLVIVVLLPGTVAADPQNVAQAARSGASNVLEFAIGDDLLAGVNHLWLGPLIGLAFGALGAAVAKAIVTVR